MRRFTTIKSGLLILCMMGSLSTQAENEGTSITHNNIIYSLSDDGTSKTATITGCIKAELTGDVTIPASVENEGSNYKVISIGENAFTGSKMTSVVIPDGVTSIGHSAFKDCSELTAATTGNGITIIPDYCFQSCSLTSVNLSTNLQEIKASSFARCMKLTSITLPEGLTAIGTWAFDTCQKLESITFPASLNNIGANAFSGTAWFNNQPNGVIYAGPVLYKCKGKLTEPTLTIKEGTTAICGSAFSYQTALTSITLPNSVTTIGASCFSGCSGLVSINLGEGITIIDDRTFSSCTTLSSVIIPDQVTSINTSAFYNCTALTDIKLPQELTTIGNSAFNKCGLTSIEIPSKVTAVNPLSFDGCPLTSVTSLNLIPPVCGTGYPFNTATYESATLTVLPASQEAYKADTIWNKFKNIQVLNNNEKYITYSFSGDGTARVTGVEKDKISGEVIIPASVEKEGTSYDIVSIADNAFQGCTTMTSVTIPNSVTKIGAEAFKDCTELTTVQMGNGITTVSENCFKSCTKLTTITLSSNLKAIENAAFSRCSALATLELPEGFTTINAWAFEECSSLTSITFPSTLTEIAGAAFFNAAWYNNQPDGVVYAGTVLYKCKGTPAEGNVEIKEGTVSISNSAFSNCAGITSITVPNSVKTIGEDAFRSCTDLTTVTLGNGITQISARTFYFSSKLTSVTIPETVTVIGANAFYGCEALPSITLPENLTTIETSAFNNCKALTTVTLPAQVTRIGDSCFSECNLEKFYSLNPTPPAFGNGKSPFTVSIFPTCYLIVPQEAVEAYKGTEWNKFERIRGLGEDGKITYAAAITLNEGGYVTINDDQTVSQNDTIDILEGSNFTFVITADKSHKIKTILLNKEDITDQLKENSYTIDAVEGDIQLDVEFEDWNSVSDLKNNDLRVITSSNKIIIENKGYEDKVSVSDIAGQNVYEGIETEIVLNSGIYIVRVGNKVSKVAIK